MNKIEYYDNCRYFYGDRPCNHHKKNGRHCKDCDKFNEIMERILIVKLDAIGDVLRTTSILPALRKKFQGSYITWLTKLSSAPILEKNIYIDRLLFIEDASSQRIQHETFDIVLGLDASHESAFWAQMANAKKRYGFGYKIEGVPYPVNEKSNEWFLMGLFDDIKKKNRKSYPEIVYEMIDLEGPVYGPQLHLVEDEISAAKIKLEKLGWYPDTGKTVLGIQTGAGDRWKKKSLPLKTFKTIIHEVLTINQLSAIFLLGGPNEKVKNDYLISASNNDPRIIHTGCDNTLREFASIVSFTDIILTGDTLALHIGMALDKFIIANFGPTSPWEIKFNKKGIRIIPDIDCICCYRNDCNIKPACNEKIDVDLITKTISEAINNYNIVKK